MIDCQFFVCCSNFPDIPGRIWQRRRRTKEIAKLYAFQVNALSIEFLNIPPLGRIRNGFGLYIVYLEKFKYGLPKDLFSVNFYKNIKEIV